jgi:hypothetical protein
LTAAALAALARQVHSAPFVRIRQARNPSEEFTVDRWENVLYTFSPSCSPEGVKLMTMISMEQEAVPAALPTTYRQVLGATRYRRAGTMTGWLNRKHRLLVGTLARRGPA